MAGLGAGLGGGGGGLIWGGGRLEPGRKNGLLATPPKQKGEKITKASRFLQRVDTCLRFQNKELCARNKRDCTWPVVM